jgi:rhamnose utilization protein RhaD (predicted bifunctional aldolase and dehydrogenase)
MSASTPSNELIKLSHDLGREDRKLAILGEGNASVRLSDRAFLVKASGSNLGSMGAHDVVECRFQELLQLLDGTDVNDHSVEETLMASRIDPGSKKPSVEGLFHAYLLSLPGIRFVAHTHPLAVNQILCSPAAEHFANRRLIPDEVIICGAKMLLIPYVEPGLVLGREVKAAVDRFTRERGQLPKVILLQNHGMIVPAASSAAALAITLMAVKAAETFIGARELGGPTFLSEKDVQRLEKK